MRNRPTWTHQFFDRMPAVPHERVIGNMPEGLEQPSVVTSAPTPTRWAALMSWFLGVNPAPAQERSLSPGEFAELRSRLKGWFLERFTRMGFPKMPADYDGFDDDRKQEESLIISGLVALEFYNDENSDKWNQQMESALVVAARQFVANSFISRPVDFEEGLVSEGSLQVLYARLRDFMREMEPRVSDPELHGLVSPVSRPQNNEGSVLIDDAVGCSCIDAEAEVTARIFAREKRYNDDVTGYLISYAKAYADVLRRIAPSSVMSQRIQAMDDELDEYAPF